MNREDYYYATGVVRQLENKVLNSTDIERMVDAPDLKAAFKVFHDTDYFDNVLDLEPHQFLEALDADLRQMRDRLVEMAPDESILHLVFMQHDFSNMKLLFKEQHSGKDLSQYISPFGNEDPERLRAAIAGEQGIEVLPYCERAIEYVKQRVNDEAKGVTPALIGRWFDRKYFKEYSDLGETFGSTFISDFVQLQLEVANLKTFLRGKQLDLPHEYIVSEILYTQGRRLTLDFFADVVKMNLEEALNKIKPILNAHGQRVLDQYLQDRSLEQLQKNLENLELEYVRGANYIDVGPEVLLAYYYAKTNGTRNARLIMMGKQNGVEPSEIKQHLRDVY